MSSHIKSIQLMSKPPQQKLWNQDGSPIVRTSFLFTIKVLPHRHISSSKKSLQILRPTKSLLVLHFSKLYLTQARKRQHSSKRLKKKTKQRKLFLIAATTRKTAPVWKNSEKIWNWNVRSLISLKKKGSKNMWCGWKTDYSRSSQLTEKWRLNLHKDWTLSQHLQKNKRRLNLI